MPRSREAYTQLLCNFPDSDKINAVSEGAEVLYLRLLAACDDEDHYYGEPAFIASKLFTSRMCKGEASIPDIDQRLGELVQIGLVRLYRVGSATYLELVERFKVRRKDVHPNVVFPQPQTDPKRNGEATSNGPETNPARVRFETVTLDQTKPDDIRLDKTNQKGTGLGGILRTVTKANLASDEWLLKTYHALVRHKFLDRSENVRQKFFGAAERALELGKNPGGFFRRIVEARDWKLVSEAQLDRAVARIKAINRETKGLAFAP